jgi:hypothetical protein
MSLFDIINDKAWYININNDRLPPDYYSQEHDPVRMPERVLPRVLPLPPRIDRVVRADPVGRVEPVVEPVVQPVDEPATDPSQECNVCLINKKAVAFIPCGHYSCCSTCSTRVNTCPVCREPIQSTQRIYIS